MTDSTTYSVIPAVITLPRFSSATPEPPLWQLIVDSLPAIDPKAEYYTLNDIAPLVNITSHALAKHCRDLWPAKEGHYRLDHSEAVTLIRRVCRAGRKLPTRDEVVARRRGEAQ